jgi:hypothetical protein
MEHNWDNQTTKHALRFGPWCSASLEQCPSQPRKHKPIHHPSLQSRELVRVATVATAAILAVVCIAVMEGVIVEQLPKCHRREGVAWKAQWPEAPITRPQLLILLHLPGRVPCG